MALSADAGDELFGGYNKYSIAIDFLKKINILPGKTKNYAGKVLKYIPDGFLNMFTKSNAILVKKQRITDLMQVDEITTPLIMDRMLSQTYSVKQMDELMVEKINKPESFFNTENNFINSVGQLDSMLAVDFKTYLPDDILAKVDRASMSVSLEGREPLLDHRLIEFVARLPEDFKLKYNSKKYILKEIVHDYVPKELMDRPKMGFGVPVFEWLRNDLKYYADEYMTAKDFAKHGLFKIESVQNIIRSFFNGNKNFDSLFWYLLMFQMWYKKWMD